MNESSERVLVLAVSSRDSESTADLLFKSGLQGVVCKSFELLLGEIDNGCGSIVLAKEVLNSDTIAILVSHLNKQPKWSFIPILILVGPGDLSRSNEETLQFLKPLRNTTLLERPVRVGTFVSIVQAALADRRRQYELRDLVIALEKSKEEAIAANRAKSEFLANMSHEIRTPLGAILGYTELILEEELPAHEKETYKTAIKRNGQLLSALINDVLDLAKVEAGRIEIAPIDFPLKELISEAIWSLQPKAREKDLEVLVNFTARIPDHARTDPVRLKQIILNIVGNAIKFTRQGKVVVDVSTTTLRNSDDMLLKIIVTDTGIGITKEQVEKLFQPFAQADGSITRKFGGTGLGLVLSRRLAQALGGNLVLKSSEFGKGSVFEASVKIKPVASLRSDVFEARRDDTLPRLDGLKLLVVDDSKDNQLLICKMLELAGAEVKTADDGEDGLKKIGEDNFDVVLMDIQMPKIGGYEATAHLRNSGYSKPIVALTAHALKEDRERCLRVGCDDYLTKPVQRKELIETVSRLSREIGAGAMFKGRTNDSDSQSKMN